jgi:DNA polymerase III epsilon subunit-like protein
MKNILNHSDLRIAVLDLEASALGKRSYPIEAGVALITGAARPIQTWSTMIRPTQGWLDVGLWSPASAAVHGISLETIMQQGYAVEDVCDWLNALLGSKTIVATDAPRYDQDWLDTLFREANREQLFTLQYRHLVYLLDRTRVPHRAGADALRLASKLMEAHLGYPPRVEDLGDLSTSREA